MDEKMRTAEDTQRCWPDLPFDILLMILRNLSFIDHLSFRSVCHGWRSASSRCPIENQPVNEPAWLMFSRETSSETTRVLLDPSNKKMYTIEIPELCGIRCLSSGHGWLLLQSPTRAALFFFNPFSKARIDLPYSNGYSALTFSSPPTFPGCTVIGISNLYQTHKVEVSICSRGESMWIRRDFHTRKSWDVFTQAVLCNGIVYFMDILGNIGTYCVADHSWSDIGGPDVAIHYDRSYVIEFGGKILACFVNTSHSSVCVFRLENRSWVKVSEVRGGILCLGLTSSVSTAVLKGIENVIFFDTFRAGSWCVLYKFQNGVFKINFRCPKSQECQCSSSVWIEPRWFEPFPNLDWTTP